MTLAFPRYDFEAAARYVMQELGAQKSVTLSASQVTEIAAVLRDGLAAMKLVTACPDCGQERILLNDTEQTFLVCEGCKSRLKPVPPGLQKFLEVNIKNQVHSNRAEAMVRQ